MNIPSNQPIQQPQAPPSPPQTQPSPQTGIAAQKAQSVLTNVSTGPSAPISQNVSAIQPVRRSLDENKEKILKEFKNGLFVRSFSDPSFEVNEVIREKLAAESDPNTMEKLYWSSGSVIQENSPMAIWEGTGDRCGFIFSSEALLGGWNMQDMATDNPQRNLSDNEIKNYFPERFPDFASTSLIKDLQGYSREKEDLVRKILNLDPSVAISPNHFTRAADYILDRMDRNHPEHAELLQRLPDEYKSVYSMKDVQTRMRDLAKKEGIYKIYNEAKIRYQPNDIVGVLVFNNPTSIAKAKILQENLEKQGFHVPFVTYQPRSGTIELYDNSVDIPQTSTAPVSHLPEKGTPEYQALTEKYYWALTNKYPDSYPLTAEEITEWLKTQAAYTNDPLVKEEVDDIDFISFVRTELVELLGYDR